MGGGKRIEQTVRDRAGGLCEYCLLPEALSKLGSAWITYVRVSTAAERARQTWRLPADSATVTRGRTWPGLIPGPAGSLSCSTRGGSDGRTTSSGEARGS